MVHSKARRALASSEGRLICFQVQILFSTVCYCGVRQCHNQWLCLFQQTSDHRNGAVPPSRDITPHCSWSFSDLMVFQSMTDHQLQIVASTVDTVIWMECLDHLPKALILNHEDCAHITDYHVEDALRQDFSHLRHA